MNKSTYRKSLDVQKQGIQFTLNAVKNEALSRQIIITILDGGKPFDFGSDNLQAILYASKPDGTVLYNNCERSKNVLTYTFTQQTLSTAGEVIARIKIVSSDEDTQVLYAPQFLIRVDDVENADDAIESTNEYTALTQASANAIKAQSAANTAALYAENAGKTAETAAASANEAKNAIETARDNGEFDGQDYILTDDDKVDIAALINSGNLKIQIVSSDDELNELLDTITADFTANVPAMLVFGYDATESMNCVQGDSIFIFDSGSGSIDDAIMMINYANYQAYTADDKAHLDKNTLLCQDYTKLSSYNAISIQNAVGQTKYNDGTLFKKFPPNEILCYFTVSKTSNTPSTLLSIYCNSMPVVSVYSQKMTDGNSYGGTVRLQLTSSGVLYEVTYSSNGDDVYHKVAHYNSDSVNISKPITSMVLLTKASTTNWKLFGRSAVNYDLTTY